MSCNIGTMRDYLTIYRKLLIMTFTHFMIYDVKCSKRPKVGIALLRRAFRDAHQQLE